jgi:hypothetical protein
MAGGIRLSMQGDAMMRDQLRRTIKEAPKELRRALLDFAESKVPIVVERTPRKTGKLQGTVRARVMVSGKKEDLRVTISAGGPDAPYARIVHETHKTQSKFIESVILESRGTAAGDIAGLVSEERLAG